MGTLFPVVVNIARFRVGNSGSLMIMLDSDIESTPKAGLRSYCDRLG